MALRRLSGDCFEDDGTCPGVWEDDEYPYDAIAVGKLLDPSPVPVGPGKVAIRMPLRLIRDAGIG
jgi:hypothetical protein